MNDVSKEELEKARRDDVRAREVAANGNY